MWIHRPSFTVVLTAASRLIHLRDRLLGKVHSRSTDFPGLTAVRHTIPSGNNVLDAIYVEPTAQPARASVLICHGIGEVADQWFPIQQILAEGAVASLVFDYSGYGRSTGSIDWTQFEEDAVSAFQFLNRLGPPGPISVLGFSLGSGIAPTVINRLKADRMVLCAAFTSFREAAHSIGVPRALSPLVPPIWDSRESLHNCKLPLLIVHSTGDRYFPVQMARDLASWSGGSARLIIVPGIGHNEPFYKPHLSYWGPIISFIIDGDP
jgi:alpha-beta hydrolase superfamily lysophospholipase